MSAIKEVIETIREYDFDGYRPETIASVLELPLEFVLEVIEECNEEYREEFDFECA